MRYRVRPPIFALLSFLLVISCSLPRFSAQGVSQRVIRLLEDRSEEELVLDYIIVTPHFTPTPTFTPTLTPTLQAASGGASVPDQATPVAEGGAEPTGSPETDETPAAEAPTSSPATPASPLTP